ncbi:MAG: hypothetical protein K0S55_1544, partial [Clostridia bacterium]|nr:hypothetical protein [Clostridia bacterium]
SVFGYAQDTLFAEMALSRISEVESKLNCNIEYSKQVDLASYIKTNLSAGVDIGEMYYGGSSTLRPAVMAYGGYLYPLNELNSIINYENSEKFGSSNILESAMYNSIPYSVFPMMWPEKASDASIGNIVMVNENLIKDYNLTDPREYVENKKWNLDTFEEITPIYNIIDGENNIKAFSAVKRSFIQSVILSNGARSTTIEDGVVKSGLFTSDIIDLINWTDNFFNLYEDNILIVNDALFVQRLVNNEIIMAVCSPEYCTSAAKELENFGIVPFPAGPKVEPGNLSGYLITMLCPFSIFKNAEEPEYAANIINELFEPFKEYETKNKLIDLLYGTVFFDRRDAELYHDLSSHTTFAYSDVGGIAFFETITAQLGKKTGAELIESLKSSYDNVIEEYIGTNYEYMSSHSYESNP